MASFLNFSNPELPAGSENPNATVGTGISLVPGKCSKTHFYKVGNELMPCGNQTGF